MSDESLDIDFSVEIIGTDAIEIRSVVLGSDKSPTIVVSLSGTSDDGIALSVSAGDPFATPEDIAQVLEVAVDALRNPQLDMKRDEE